MTSEFIFWCIAGLMLAAAAFFIAAAFLRTRLFSGQEETSEKANRKLLNEELEVLEKEKAAGLISQSIYEESVDDVRRRALEELSEKAPVQTQEKHKTAVMLCVCLFVVAGALAVYLKIGAPGMIPFVESQRTHGLMRADGTLAAAAPQYDAELMTAYLKRNPNDERAWVLLARLYVKQRDWSAAIESYRAALDLNQKVVHDPEVWIEYAASIMSLPEPDAYEKGLPAAAKALSLDETNANAHELYAIACLETARWKEALEHLEYLLSRLHMDTPQYQKLARTAAFAAQMLRAHEPDLEGNEKHPAQSN